MSTSEKTAPDVDDIRAQLPATLQALYEKYRWLDEGKVADYIPELAGADPGGDDGARSSPLRHAGEQAG